MSSSVHQFERAGGPRASGASVFYSILAGSTSGRRSGCTITSTSCDRDGPDGHVVWPCRVLPRTAVPTPGADRQTDRQTGEALLPGGTSAGEALTAAYPQPPQVCSRTPLYGAVCGLSSVVWERCNNVNKEGYLMPTPRTHSAYRHTLAPPMYRSKLAFSRGDLSIYICVSGMSSVNTLKGTISRRAHMGSTVVESPSLRRPIPLAGLTAWAAPAPHQPHIPPIGIALPS